MSGADIKEKILTNAHRDVQNVSKFNDAVNMEKEENQSLFDDGSEADCLLPVNSASLNYKEESCECKEHFEETIMYIGSMELDKAVLDKCRSIGSLFNIPDIDDARQIVFFKSNFTMFGDSNSFRVRCSQTILSDGPRVFSFEYKLTVMGMSGGDGRINLRLCSVLDGTKCNLIATCEVVPPKDSWFKKQISQGLLEWTFVHVDAVTKDNNLLDQSNKSKEWNWPAQFESLRHRVGFMKKTIIRIILILLFVSVYSLIGHIFWKQSSGNISRFKPELSSLDEKYAQIMRRLNERFRLENFNHKIEDFIRQINQ